MIERSLSVKGMELTAQLVFAIGDLLSEFFYRQGAVLKTAFGKYRHRKPSYRLNTARHDFPFEGVQFIHTHACESGKGDAFGYIKPGAVVVVDGRGRYRIGPIEASKY